MHELRCLQGPSHSRDDGLGFCNATLQCQIAQLRIKRCLVKAFDIAPSHKVLTSTL